MPGRDDGNISWGTGEHTFRIGIFQHDEPGFKESAILKFDMLAPCRMVVLLARCNVPQFRTIGLGVLAGDGSAWVCKKHNHRGWMTPSCDWELWTQEVLEQCNDILADARVLDAMRVTSW